MNILRWKRKSKKKVKLKTIILFIFSLIMTTFAWFAYSRVLDTTLNIHMASWDMEYWIGSEQKTNPISINIPTLYPAMPEYTVTIDIKNNGEKLVDIDYYVNSITIAGTSYEIVREGSTPTTSSYIMLSPSVLETYTTTETDSETNEEVEIVTQLIKGAIISDITKFPFTVTVEHSAQVDPVSVDENGNEVSGEGYLTVTVNWVGDNNELDSEWGYIVGEYLKNNPTATSVMSIELRLDAYQAEGNTTVGTDSLPSTTETTPYLPTGFTRLAGTTLETGLVIKDSSGNEYVWVEVPKNSTVYPNAGLSITSFSDTEYSAIETDLNNYTATYDTRADEYTSYNALGISSDAYQTLKNQMLKSIYENGGFYIGRYETGINGTFRTAPSTSTPTQTPVIQAHAYPYNYIKCDQAQTLAQSMSSGSYTSSLMFGLQWDLVMKYLETKGVSQSALSTDSTSWGNYINNEYDITNIKALYSINGGGTWAASPYNKATDLATITTTGASSIFSKQNIYDLAGNMSEWTLNITFSGSTPIGGNGGDYSLTGTNSATYRGAYDATAGVKQVGFRIVIF